MTEFMTQFPSTSATAREDEPAPFEAREASFGYSAAPLLVDVNLTIHAGEFVAILGTNGSGKSTLMRGLLGLLPARTGQVRICGLPAARFRQWQRIAYVPQRLLAAGTVPVNVREVVGSARVRGWGTGTRRTDRTACDLALDAVGMTAFAGQRFDGLSGGQQRRVMVAQALAKHARIFVLDEPTAGVDASAQEQLAAIFASLHASGATVLLVTHELGVFSSLVTRVLVMQPTLRGGIGFDGPPQRSAVFQEQAWHHGHELEPHDHQPGLLEP